MRQDPPNDEVMFEVPISEVPIVPRLEATAATEQPTPQAHLGGNCEPCVFFTSQHGCMHGSSCHYCHLPHEENSCPRPRKQTRDKIKERILQLFIANPANLHDELQSEARQHPYALRIIRGYLEDEIVITWEGSDLEARWRPEGLVFSV